MDHPDPDFIRTIKSGDEQAFEKLFFKFYEPLCHFAARYVDSMKIAEEMVQEVFTNVWEIRAGLDDDLNIRSYLYQAVKNQALDHIKHEKVAKKYEREVELQLYEEVYEASEECLSEKGFIKAALNAIEDLPGRTRHIYKMSRKDGLTYSEIAEILDISVKTVEYHMTKSLRILRDKLRHYLPAFLLCLLENLVG